MPDPIIGRRLGKYVIEQEIGRGGMARVYRAADTVLQRPVALKVLAPSLSADPEFAHRFEREAITAANLRHPAIVTIFDVGEAESLRYIAMEYIAGRTLNDVLEEQGRLSIPLTIAILSPVAEALDFAHNHGMVHRDVKPHNIMVDTDGRVLLTDFGIAISPAEGGDRLTRTGMFMGTPEYLSPEQAQAQPLTGRSDLYSLGIVAYEMLSGRVPFEGATPQQIMAHVYHAPPPITNVDRSLPPELDQLFARVLAKDPNQRFERAGALVEALRYVARRYGMNPPTREEVAALAVPRGSSAGQATVAMSAPPPVAAVPPRPQQRPTPPPAAFPIEDVFGQNAQGRRAPTQSPIAPQPGRPPRTPAAGTPFPPQGRVPTGGQRPTGGRQYNYNDEWTAPRLPRRPAYDDGGNSNVPWTLLALGAIALVTIALVFALTQGEDGLFAATPSASFNPFDASPTPTTLATPTVTTVVIIVPPTATFIPGQPTNTPETALLPTETPTVEPVPPTPEPTLAPTAAPTAAPTDVPIAVPTETATVTPTADVTALPATITPTALPSSTPLNLPTATVAPTGVPTPVGGGGTLAFFEGDTLQLLDPSTETEPATFALAFDMQGPVAISPDGETILIDALDENGEDRHIFAIDRDTEERTQLTDGSGSNYHASWRPDGNAIVFASTREGDADVYIMNLDGSNQRPLTTDPADDQFPSFSPDGTRILFESNRDGQAWAIYTIDAQGGAATRITPTDQITDDRSPRWSPDGSTITFVSNRDPRDNGEFEVYTQPIDGTATRITDFVSGDVNGPVYSPDGTLIAFFGDRNGRNDLYIVDPAADELLSLPSTPDVDERWPFWSR